VIVAVIAVWMVQPSVHQEVDVIAVRHRLVPAAVGVGVAGSTARRLSVTFRVPGVHRDHVLIDVVVVWVVKMAFVEVIDVIVVADRDMATSLLVDVRVAALVNRVRHAPERTGRPPLRQPGNDETYSQTGLSSVAIA
jgi:hypothetical protein